MERATVCQRRTGFRSRLRARRVARVVQTIVAALALASVTAGTASGTATAIDADAAIDANTAIDANAAIEAPERPRIATVRFEGNDVTRESTLLREIPLVAGDRADPAVVDAGRQALLDLELFREVEARTELREDGRVDLVYRVREKRYLLPIPRVDTSSDGDTSYGLQLRWSNVAGLGHRLNAYAERGEYPEDRRRREERSLRLGYDAPFLIRDQYDLQVDLGQVDRVIPRDGATYDERARRLELLVTEDRRSDRPRDGWIVGGGLLFDDRESAGAVAPPSDGMAVALVGVATYSDERYHVFSETGRRAALRVESAASALGSDYSYTRVTADAVHSFALGDVDEHHSLRWLGSAGAVIAGTGSRDEFGLGGSGRLRGYPSDFLIGNRYAYGAVEYLRPLRWDWLRLLVVAEAGAADDDIAGVANGRPEASIGIGVRIRVPWFVGVELEVGVAKPLSGGDVRVFAGGN